MLLQLALSQLLLVTAGAQTFQRLGTCPKLGCIFPPDQVDFLPGQYFDIRTEVHAYANGTRAGEDTTPNRQFSLTIQKEGQEAQDVTKFFDVNEPRLENWNFTYYEDLFAEDAERPTQVNAVSKAYRRIALYEPGTYYVTLNFNNGETTRAEWLVRDIDEVKRAKNVLLFIGDGMTTNMITAARLMAHKSINGRYQSQMKIDDFPVIGHQMTHSIDSFITDSANSATALYSGHKSTVNALGVHKDSSPDPFDDPKIESIAEIFQRLTGGGIGIVSTAYIADATPAALSAHTADRDQYDSIIETFLNGNQNYSWGTDWKGPDVLFGGGAEQFYTDPAPDVEPSYTFRGQNYYDKFRESDYGVALNNTALQQLPNDEKALGIFRVSTMDVWLDRNIYTDNLRGQASSPDGQGADATDQPGLRDMTVKAIDILSERHSDAGWFLMSEAASVDKQMHALDYDRALGDLLELDDTVRGSIARLAELDQLDDTLVIVTADHGHGFDVMGSADTKYLAQQQTDREKRKAIGIYERSGLSQYTDPNSERGPGPDVENNNSPVFYTEGTHFPANWDPRYTLFSGVSADPDRRENYQVHKGGPREPAVNITEEEDYYVNPEDAPAGFVVNGTLPVSEPEGVHSLTDVPVYAIGPCQEIFGGTYGNIDVFFGMAQCLGLSRRGPGRKGSTYRA
ncbi:MAG: hypothetical protein M1831_004553 [Alyxoria varia]|nr:MAG: hypothetical protein M1831_004553 [Alyxoria varia]